MRSLFAIFFLIAVIALPQGSAQNTTAPCGIAAYVSVNNRNNTLGLSLYTLNLTSPNSSKVYDLPSASALSASSYAVPETGNIFIFYEDKMVAIQIATGNMSTFALWKTPSNVNGGHYGERGMQFAGYDATQGVLYALQSDVSGSSTWLLYASDFASQRWIALSNITVPATLTHYYFSAMLTRDNKQIAVLVTPSLSGGSGFLSIFSISSRIWSETRKIVYPKQSAFKELYPSTNQSNLLVWLQTTQNLNAVSFSLATGKLVSSFKPGSFQPPYAQMAPTRLTQTNQYLLPGCSLGSANTLSARIELYDIDAGVVAYNWHVPVPHDNPYWSVACVFTWISTGCPFH